MAFYTKTKLDFSDIEKTIKRGEKDSKKYAKIHGVSKKEQDAYAKLPGKREKSSEIKMDNSESSSIVNAYKNINELNEDSVELEKTRVKFKDPIKLLKELNDKRHQAEELMKEEAFKAGKMSVIIKAVRKFFRARAEKYLGENMDKSSVKPFAGLASELLEKGVDHVYGNNTELNKSIFNNAFGYVSFKIGSMIADVDHERIDNDISEQFKEFSGGPITLRVRDITGGQRERSQKRVYNVLSKMPVRSDRYFFVNNLASKAVFEKNKLSLKYDDIIEFYGQLAMSTEESEQFFDAHGLSNKDHKLAQKAYDIANTFSKYKTIKPKLNVIDTDKYDSDVKRSAAMAAVAAVTEVGLAFAGPLLSKGVGKLLSKSSTMLSAKFATKIPAIIGNNSIGTLSQLSSNKNPMISVLGKQFAKGVALPYLTPALTAVSTYAGCAKLNNQIDNMDLLEDYQKTAIKNLLADYQSNVWKASVQQAKDTSAIKIASSIAKTDAMRHKQFAAQLSRVYQGLVYEDTFSIPKNIMEKYGDTPITLRQIRDNIIGKDRFNALVPNDFRFIEELFNDDTKKVTLKKINYLFYMLNVIKTLSKDDPIKDVKQRINGKSPFSTAGKNTFTQDRISKFIGEFVDSSSSSDNAISLTDLSTIKNFMNMNVNSDVNIEDDGENEEITEESSKLWYGWYQKPKYFAGADIAGDFVYLIRHVPELCDRYIEIQAALKLIPNDLKNNDGNKKIEYYDIRKYAKQYKDYYENASFITLTNEEKLDLDYITYCLNGADFSWDTFEIFHNLYWNDKYDELTSFLFDIIYDNGIPKIISSSEAVMPDPEEHNINIRNALFKKILDLSKKSDSSNNKFEQILQGSLNIKSDVKRGTNVDEAELFSDYDILEPNFQVSNSNISENDNDLKNKYDTSFIAARQYSDAELEQYIVQVLNKRTPWESLQEYRNLFTFLLQNLNSMQDTILMRIVNNALLPKINIANVNEPDNYISIYDLYNNNVRNVIEKSNNFYKSMTNNTIPEMILLMKNSIKLALNIVELAQDNIYHPNIVYYFDNVAKIPNGSSKNKNNNYDTMEVLPKYLLKNIINFCAELLMFFRFYFYGDDTLDQKSYGTDLQGYFTAEITEIKEESNQNLLDFIRSVRGILFNIGNLDIIEDLISKILENGGNLLDNSMKIIYESKKIYSGLASCLMNLSQKLLESTMDLIPDVITLAQSRLSKSNEYMNNCRLGYLKMKTEIEKNNSQRYLLIGQCRTKDSIDSEISFYDLFVPDYYKLTSLWMAPVMVVLKSEYIKEIADKIKLTGSFAAMAAGATTGIGFILGLAALTVTVIECSSPAEINNSSIEIANGMSDNLNRTINFAIEQYGSNAIMNREMDVR